MANPFNPLDWLQSAQDWFIKSERSSGFRPYLIFLILVFGIAIFLLTYFEKNQFITFVAIGLILIPTACFVVLYFIKSFQDPDFCHSETHIQTIKKIEMERLGSDLEQIDNEIIEQTPTTKAPHERPALPLKTREEGKV